MEKTHKRYVRNWKFLSSVTHGWIDRRFNFSHDMSEFEKIEGPVIIIPNHVCDWDPILMGSACKNRQVYFVMSEHMVREPFIGKIINLLFGTILRRKASTDLEVVKNCIRHVKAGHSICLFAEGDQSWDGVTGKVYPATGKLVKLSKATLVTYRLEGAFLSRPRWATGTRRGRINGIIAGIYSPEELKQMTGEEIQTVIERDLYFDIWDWQRSMPGGPVAFKGRRKNRDFAKGIDMLFFMCPGCGSIGTIKTDYDEIFCGCGFRARFLNTGFIEPVSDAVDHPPYDLTLLSGWDSWQRDELEKKVQGIIASGSEEVLFKDGPVILSLVDRDHKDMIISTGDISLSFKEEGAVLSAGDRSFVLKEIKDMGMILSELILFTYKKEYYQIKAKGINIRKYVLVWNMVNS